MIISSIVSLAKIGGTYKKSPPNNSTFPLKSIFRQPRSLVVRTSRHEQSTASKLLINYL